MTFPSYLAFLLSPLSLTLTHRSTTGYCTFLDSTLLSWNVKKQPIVARSFTQDEYIALASTTTDIIWLRQLPNDFSIALSNNLIFHARTKHFEIDYHFIREHIQSNEN